MLLSESDVHSVLISKRFLSGFLSLRNYKLKSVTRTLHIVHVSFFLLFYSACWRKFTSYYSDSTMRAEFLSIFLDKSGRGK